jgi:hypothetical protein
VSPAAPSVRLVTNPPMSPIDRRTPPSAVNVNHDHKIIQINLNVKKKIIIK